MGILIKVKQLSYLTATDVAKRGKPVRAVHTAVRQFSEAITFRLTLRPCSMSEVWLACEDPQLAGSSKMVLQGDGESLASLQIKITSKIAAVDLQSLPKHSQVHVDR